MPPAQLATAHVTLKQQAAAIARIARYSVAGQLADLEELRRSLLAQYPGSLGARALAGVIEYLVSEGTRRN